MDGLGTQEELRTMERHEIMEKLEAGIEAVMNTEGFERWLRALARFHSYSFGNVCLIMAQKPDATAVAGYRKWQELGRQVKKGERAIRILVPHVRRVGETTEGDPVYAARSFGAGAVFDISQTEGDALPPGPRAELLTGESSETPRLRTAILAWLGSTGVPVTWDALNGPRGMYKIIDKSIVVDNALGPDQELQTLFHEAAHYIAGHATNDAACDAETVAESAAYVVSAHYGLDTGRHTFPYVASWAQDKEVFKRNLAAIQQTADVLIRAIGSHLAA